MSPLHVSLPEWLIDEVERLAGSERISVDRLVATALAEAVATARDHAFFEERAGAADRAAYLGVLRRGGDAEPSAGDRLTDHDSITPSDRHAGDEPRRRQLEQTPSGAFRFVITAGDGTLLFTSREFGRKAEAVAAMLEMPGGNGSAVADAKAP
jgi:hypothetical protein